MPTPTTVPQYEKTRKPTLSIWPNPSSDMVVLWGVDLKKSVVTIINLLGQVVIERQLPNTSGSVSLDISNLEKGVYVVKVASSQQTLTEILVKQ
ncbi:MAG TPA: T9SS type A sorting domain-containing protein [Flavobacteriales bacterium]|nr:T9SS type A sorting domain-containing protein [Flavobacteriales bacterium]